MEINRTKTQVTIRPKAAEKMLQNLKAASLRVDGPAKKIIENGITQAERWAR